MKLFPSITGLISQQFAKLAGANAAPKGDKQRVSYQLKRQYQFKVELQMDNFRQAIDMAENPQNPNRQFLYSIYNQIIDDCHLTSQIQTAKFSVQEQPFVLFDIKNKKPDEEKVELLQRPWFDDFIDFALDAQYWGHSLIEFAPLVQSTLGLEFEQVMLMPREHVRPETGEVVLAPNDRKGIPYREEPFSKWLIEIGGPTDLGALKKASKEVIFKNFSRSDWSRRGEKFGMPFVILKTASNSATELDRKEEMLANIGSNGYAILDDQDEYSIVESTKADGHLIFKDKAEYCDSQLSKLIVGQTMTSDDGASLSQSEVHERILDRYVMADLRFIQKLVNFRLLPFLIRHGYPLEGYRFAYKALLKEDKEKEKTDPNKPDPKEKGAGKLGFNLPSAGGTAEGLSELYAGCCSDHQYQLAAGVDSELQAEIEAAAKAIHEGNLQPGSISPRLQMAIAKELWNGVKEGWGKDFEGIQYGPDTALLGRMRQNVFGFSAAKSFTEMEVLRDLTYDNQGKRLPWSEYKELALQVNEKYNLQHLDTERDAVLQGSTMGSRWLDIQARKDLYPYLRYKTVGDKRVRDSHATLEGVTLPVDDPFWQQYFPQNDWNCRCDVEELSQEQVQRQGIEISNPDLAAKAAGQAVPKQWRKNTGTSGLVFEDGHIYYQSVPGGKLEDLRAVENYQLRTIDQIYADPSKLPTPAGKLKDAEDFDTWWKDMQGLYPADQPGAFVLKDKQGIPMLFDQEMRGKLLEKGRHLLADEILNMVSKPDEVYEGFLDSQKYGREQFTVYIRYYKETPHVLLVNTQGRVDSYYPLANKKIIGQYRRGILLQKK